MSHAEAARLRLTGAAAKVAGDTLLPEAVRDRAADVLIDGTSVERAADMTGALLLAIEAAADAVDTSRAMLQSVLVAYFEETGAARIDAGSHYIAAAAGRQSVIVTEPELLPQHLTRTKVEPDKAAIAEAMKAGPVAGATWSNSKITIRRTIKKGTPA